MERYKERNANVYDFIKLLKKEENIEKKVIKWQTSLVMNGQRQ